MMMMELNDVNHHEIESFRLQQLCSAPQPEVPQFQQQQQLYPTLHQLEQLLDLKTEFIDSPSWSPIPSECNNSQIYDEIDQGVPQSPCLVVESGFESYFTFPDPPFEKKQHEPTTTYPTTTSTHPTTTSTVASALPSTYSSPTDFASRGPVISMGPEGLKLVKGYESDYFSDSDYASIDSPTSPPAPCNTESKKISSHTNSSSSRQNNDTTSTKFASSSASAGKRRTNHRLAPLPKFWSEELLQMPTKQLNLYLKEKNFTAQEITALKTCRRRIKNRGYTRSSRQRKSNETGLESPH